MPASPDDVVIGAGANVAVPSGVFDAGSISLGGPTAVLTLKAAGAYADIEGTLGSNGVALLGSSDAAHPAGILGVSLTLGAGLSVDVTGTADLGLFETYLTTGTTTLVPGSAVNVGPGGSLRVLGGFLGTGAVHVASGTLDLTGATFGRASGPAVPIQMDDGAARLVLGPGQTATVKGFRAGDVLDFSTYQNPVPAAPFSPGTYTAQLSGDQLQVLYNGSIIRSVTLAGQQMPGATYQVSFNGSTDLLVTTTAQPAATVTFTDQTTGAAGSHALDAASGGPSYLQWQYLDAGSNTIAMSAGVPNVFLKGGAGNKALAVTSGQNVLDGGTGSGFLVGGSGTDTFFVDVRSTNTVWDTLANFHAGDAVTVWGWSSGSGTERWDVLDGAPGYQGATLRLAGGQGGPVSSVTFAGISADQAAHLQMATGTAGGLDYLYISNPGV